MPTEKQVQDAIKALLRRYGAESAVLFGSYARGEQTDSSDIDVIVFGGKNFKKKQHLRLCRRIAPDDRQRC